MSAALAQIKYPPPSNCSNGISSSRVEVPALSFSDNRSSNAPIIIIFLASIWLDRFSATTVTSNSFFVSGHPSRPIAALLSPLRRAIMAEAGQSQAIGGFVPRDDLSIIALSMFAFSAAIHWTHFSRFRWHLSMLTLTIGMTVMTVGFGIRLLYARSASSLGIYVFMNMCILLSPCAFLATDYMLLVRLAYTVDEQARQRCLPIRPTLIVRLFVGSDITTFILQGCGGGLTAIGGSVGNVGTKISMFGLSLQLLSFAIFTALLLNFGWRLRIEFTDSWRPQAAEPPFKTFSWQPRKDWRVLYFITCATCVGILIRSVFRIVEFAGGYTGFVSTHEAYFYIFDALPLWIATTLYCFVWPSTFLPSPTSRANSTQVPVDSQILEVKENGEEQRQLL
ncbi:RTA1 like protein-domain-containing protein [Mycena alexandri]|uniref:RTA1 like protein-domain-containing protein n=1 Tax=Mycena alexandri TaxID=1745969 RepID=A0AAD6SFR1_9AGAR|nr:RTA1 like protein-domain-containing protein [Mycena alexandri]